MDDEDDINSLHHTLLQLEAQLDSCSPANTLALAADDVPCILVQEYLTISDKLLQLELTKRWLLIHPHYVTVFIKHETFRTSLMTNLQPSRTRVSAVLNFASRQVIGGFAQALYTIQEHKNVAKVFTALIAFPDLNSPEDTALAIAAFEPWNTASVLGVVQCISAEQSISEMKQLCEWITTYIHLFSHEMLTTILPVLLDALTSHQTPLSVTLTRLCWKHSVFTLKQVLLDVKQSEDVYELIIALEMLERVVQLSPPAHPLEHHHSDALELLKLLASHASLMFPMSVISDGKTSDDTVITEKKKQEYQTGKTHLTRCAYTVLISLVVLLVETLQFISSTDHDTLTNEEQDILCELFTTLWDTSNRTAFTTTPSLFLRLFQDDDTALFQALYGLLRIDMAVVSNKDGHVTMPSWISRTFNPSQSHAMFVLLVTGTYYDVSFFIDLLMSNETCMLLYLTTYVKFATTVLLTNINIIREIYGASCDEIIRTIIRLRLKLQRLHNAQLFPYNIQPFIARLIQFELRFDNNVNAILQSEQWDHDGEDDTALDNDWY